MHYTTSTVIAALATTASAYSATGRTFAVNHFYGKGPLMVGRVDPLTNPGTASGHVHAIQGGNAFGETMTDTQALSSTCTSSRVKADNSNYWTPALYFQDPKTGELEDVEMFYMNVYYFFEATTDKIQAFPPGLRMLVGDPFLRTPPATGGKSITDLSDGTPQPIQFTCPRSNTNSPLYPTNSDGLHGVGIQDPGNGGAGVGFPDQNCDGYASPLRADVHFPSCYNPAAGLDNYKENMQFPTNGNCPEGWIHTPHLFYEVYWNTPAFASRWTQGQGTQPFVLSQGDATGYGLHGDFIAGWDVDALQQIIDNCNAGDSGMDKCPGLMGGLNDPSTSCNKASPVDEVITGTLSKLPGNNPIGPWGVNVAPPAGGAAPVSVPAVKPTTAPAVVKTSAAGKATTAKPTTAKPTTAKAVKSSGPAPSVSKIVKPVAPAPTSAPVVGGGSNTLVTSIVSETTTILTTVTADGPAPTPASGGDDIPGFTYSGCFSDTKSGTRVLSGVTFANVGEHAVSNTKCTAYCGAAGYSLAGTEYGGQCFCGNELVGSAALNESRCEMPCEGDAKETCGGSLALSVYKVAAKKERKSRHIHRHILRSS